MRETSFNLFLSIFALGQKFQTSSVDPDKIALSGATDQTDTLSANNFYSKQSASISSCSLGSSLNYVPPPMIRIGWMDNL